MLHYIDFLTITFASIIYFFISILWYSSWLFGGKNSIDTENRKKILFYFKDFIAAWIFVFFLAVIELYLDVTSFWDGVIAGGLVWIGFILSQQFSDYLYLRKCKKHFFIDTFCRFFQVITAGGILAG